MHTDPAAYEAAKDKILRNHSSLRTWNNVATDIIATVNAGSTKA
jgi:hypothetical protein